MLQRRRDAHLLGGNILGHEGFEFEFATSIESDSTALHTLVAAIPVLPQVAAACELLGLDPLYIANEGKLVASTAPEVAGAVLATMRAHPLGQRAARIGQVSDDANRFVQMHTGFGGRRVVDWLSGEPLPRIC